MTRSIPSPKGEAYGGKARHIPDSLKDEVLKQHAEGKTAPQIAQWLTLHEDRQIPSSAVTNLLAKVAQDRRQAMASVYRDRLAPGVFSDLDILDAIAAREWQAYASEPDDFKRQRTASLLLKLIALRGAFMGMGQQAPEASAAGEVQAELLRKIRALPKGSGKEAVQLPPEGEQ